MNKTLDLKNKELKELNNFMESVKGPFKTKFDHFMESLKLKRQGYHNGALVGNDIEKIYGKSRRKNITKFRNVFNPITIKLHDGTERVFSSSMLWQKLFTLLLKFGQVYKLIMLSRTLCKHEVSLLIVRCYSLGNWFPVSFPDETLSRTFHEVRYHVPEKVADCFTVGLYAENMSESIHPVINKFKRRYSSVTDLKMQLSLICKDQWVSGNPTVHDYRLSKKAASISTELTKP